MALNVTPSPRLCLVLAPLFESNYSSAKQSAWLVDSIISTVFQNHFPNFVIEREGNVGTSEVLTELSLARTLKTDLVIADISRPAPSIIYQLGLRRALRQPSITMVQAGVET